MKIEKENAGILTNCEVYDFLNSRGAKSDPMACLGSVSPSECKVFEYLSQTPASTQTRELVSEFIRKSEKFKLSNTEKLNIINLTPTGQPEIYSMIKDCAKRFVKSEERIIGGEMELVTLEDQVQEIIELVEMELERIIGGEMELVTHPPEIPQEEV